MKKILFFVLMAFSMLFVNAQPSTSFWSNWSVGGNVTLTKQCKHENWKIGQGSNIGFGINAHKKLINNFGLRISANIPGLFSYDTIDGIKYDRYGNIMLGLDYQFVNNFYAFVDCGLGMSFNKYPEVRLMDNIGLGYIYDINKHNSLYIESGLSNILYPAWENTSVFVNIGYKYNFGLTKTDKQLLSQWYLVQSKFNKYDSIVEYHQKACPDTVFAYLQKIDEMHHENERLNCEIEKRDDIISMLDSILNDIRTNSDNFYAMPFSIEFDNDSYRINKSQYEKLKQIAYIMNSDTTINYNIVGYCDYTGSVEYNQKLSEKRAEEVKRYLVNHFGVKDEQLETNGKGKDIAFGSIKSPINRRVSFFRVF
ncbi:MAG: OmpA family protein [Bacteroidaceae bacterium]|nr:OmpA family protein [Bacteroidaceae bacterium]